MVVRFENVSLNYDADSTNESADTDVLHDINFNLPRGSFHFLTGPSGAGKTSLLRLVFLALKPNRGAVYLFDKNTDALPRQDLPYIRRKIGVVFQEFRLLEHMSIYENVALPLRAMGEREQHYQRNILELLDWVGLGDKAQSLPSVLSGGEQQRAAIARAVVNRPEIIIADEPTGNVDPDMGHRLMRLLVELNRQGTTVIVATHDQHLWQGFAYPRLHLTQGRLQILPAHQKGASQ